MAMIDAMPRVSSPIFVGRTAELDRLCRALDRAGSRQPSVVLIAGEAGIGKTRLVTEFSLRAREGGARVLIGGSMQVGETGLPYAPIVGACARSFARCRRSGSTSCSAPAAPSWRISCRISAPPGAAARVPTTAR